MNPRQISEHTGFQEPDALTVQRASGYLHNSAKDTGFQELFEAHSGFQELFEAHSGFPELHLQPFGISGTKPSGFREPRRQKRTPNPGPI